MERAERRRNELGSTTSTWPHRPRNDLETTQKRHQNDTNSTFWSVLPWFGLVFPSFSPRFDADALVRTQQSAQQGQKIYFQHFRNQDPPTLPPPVADWRVPQETGGGFPPGTSGSPQLPTQAMPASHGSGRSRLSAWRSKR